MAVINPLLLAENFVSLTQAELISLASRSVSSEELHIIASHGNSSPVTDTVVLSNFAAYTLTPYLLAVMAARANAVNLALIAAHGNADLNVLNNVVDSGAADPASDAEVLVNGASAGLSAARLVAMAARADNANLLRIGMHANVNNINVLNAIVDNVAADAATDALVLAQGAAAGLSVARLTAMVARADAANLALIATHGNADLNVLNSVVDSGAANAASDVAVLTNGSGVNIGLSVARLVAMAARADAANLAMIVGHPNADVVSDAAVLANPTAYTLTPALLAAMAARANVANLAAIEFSAHGADPTVVLAVHARRAAIAGPVMFSSMAMQIVEGGVADTLTPALSSSQSQSDRVFKRT